MHKKELKEMLEKVKKVEDLIYDIQNQLRKEIFFDDIEKEVKRIFDKDDNKEFSILDITEKIWVNKGRIEFKNKEDYCLESEFNNLEHMVRNVVFKLDEEDRYLKLIRKKKTEQVEIILHKKA